MKYDKKYDNIVANLLGRIVVVDDINEASRVARALDYRNRVVTADGQVINAGGSFTGAAFPARRAVQAASRRWRSCAQSLKPWQKKQAAAQENTDRWKAEVDTPFGAADRHKQQAITAGGDKIRAEMELHRIETALSQAQAAANCRRPGRRACTRRSSRT